MTDITCVKVVYAQFLSNKTHLIECDCPRECHQVDYHTTSSFANYPTKFHADFLAKTNQIIRNKFSNKTEITQNDLSRRMARLHIYFNELKEIKVSQKPKMLAFDLISQIGSNSGIFLGISFLSFCEIFEILIESLVIYSQARFKQPNLRRKKLSKSFKIKHSKT